MNRSATTTVSVLVTAVLTGAALTACGVDRGSGQAVEVRPPASSAAAEIANPREHLGHRDVAGSHVATVVNPNEHLAHRDGS